DVEAYTAGTIPVGAVVVDETGAVVARGRNRIFDRPSGRELGASRLAHAEINALLALTSERTYEGWTLYSALEPCHLCLPAPDAGATLSEAQVRLREARRSGLWRQEVEALALRVERLVVVVAAGVLLAAGPFVWGGARRAGRPGWAGRPRRPCRSGRWQC